jgi:hypothetical protein
LACFSFLKAFRELFYKRCRMPDPFEYTLAYYELNIIDKSVLNSKMIEKELPKHLKRLTL